MSVTNRGLVISICVTMGACESFHSAYTCHSNADCISGATQGFCEAAAVCSFPDTQCESGRRYAPYSGSFAGTCVGAPGVDAAPDAGDGDANPDAPPSPVPHLPAGGDMPGTGDLTLGTIAIDTTALTIDGATPTGGVTFDVWAQSPSGPGLAVLHVRALVISSGATTRVIGGRPLVVVAGGDVTINGVLDASAHGSSAGAGGSAPGVGAGHGGNGISGPGSANTGGGGAGFGAAGGNGCDANNRNGGAGGTTYGDATATVLQGGSGGGAASGCTSIPGGAGGGAIQIWSAGTITIAGAGGINAGGGGGNGGGMCSGTDWGSGAGAGSGGVIFLQADAVTNDGVLAANGGGGGGGALGCGPAALGQIGQDGQLGSDAALGGTGAATDRNGLPGGSLTSNPATAPACPANNSICTDPNGGGGGAAVGVIRIVTHQAFSAGGTISPAPSTGSF